MISRKGKYALRSALFLARRYGGGPISVDEIAATEGISRKFLETIMQELKKGGVLRSQRGKLGGYMLAESPQEVTVGRVLRIIEGTLSPVPCLDDSGHCEDCRSASECLIKLAMQEVASAISQILDNKSLDRLLCDGQSRDAAMMFHI